jgi:hypothetical protein
MKCWALNPKSQSYADMRVVQEMQRKFEKYGDVEKARIVRNNVNGESRGFGFVQMKDDDGADKVLPPSPHVIIVDPQTLQEETEKEDGCLWSLNRTSDAKTPRLQGGGGGGATQQICREAFCRWPELAPACMFGWRCHLPYRFLKSQRAGGTVGPNCCPVRRQSGLWITKSGTEGDFSERGPGTPETSRPGGGFETREAYAQFWLLILSSFLLNICVQ